MDDQPDFSDWIGRADTPAVDHITPRLQDSFTATFGTHLADADGAALGLHWCLSPPTVTPNQLGHDGHPAKGGFLPPVPLPRRMWASGEIQFHAHMRIGDEVTKTSTIDNIAWKTGKSGTLCFVTVAHQYASDRGVAVTETQNIVYRAAANGPSAPPGPIAPPKFDVAEDVDINSVHLFRYSALTFNAHRIHYDQAYATGAEYYDDLVIHGPLQATLLLNLAAKIGKSSPARFKYRGVAPATGAQTLKIGAARSHDGLVLFAVSQSGGVTMQGQASW